jgi:hypothetical protein
MSDFLDYFFRSLLFLASHSATFVTLRGTEKSSTKEQKFCMSNIFVTLQKTWTLHNNFKGQIGTNANNVFFCKLPWYFYSFAFLACIQLYCVRNRVDRNRGCHISDSHKLGVVQQTWIRLPVNINASPVKKFTYSDGVILSYCSDPAWIRRLSWSSRVQFTFELPEWIDCQYQVVSFMEGIVPLCGGTLKINGSQSVWALNRRTHILLPSITWLISLTLWTKRDKLTSLHRCDDTF